VKAPGARTSAKLAATMLEVALAEVSEPERLRRGRRYARQGAVIDVVVEPGLVRGSVQGSRAQPYEVVVRVLAGPAGSARLTDLVPSSGQLGFQCTCPDWEQPCKHGVAVLTHLAERVADEPSLLATWRGVTETADTGDTSDTGRDAAATAHVRDAAAGADLRADLDAFLAVGRELQLDVPDLTPLPHVTMSWDEPWSVMLHDALRVLSTPPRTR
jgi:uncharacterized Zn finger protein